MGKFILKMQEAEKYLKDRYTNCKENNEKLIIETMEKYELSYITIKAMLDDLKRKRPEEKKPKYVFTYKGKERNSFKFVFRGK